MRQAEIISIQRGCVYDGPGVRTTIFLRDCPLKCPWCCNPEAAYADKMWMIDESKCINNAGIDSIFCDDCERKGGAKPLSDCEFGVAERISRLYTSEELSKQVLEDYELFLKTGGGITFSGGEPLLYTDFIKEVLDFLPVDINVYIESTLVVPLLLAQSVMSKVDGLIVDLKLQREIGIPLESYIDNIKRITGKLNMLKKDITYRLVFVESVLEDAERIIDSLHQIGATYLELLKCHNLAKNKYIKLGIENRDYTPKDSSILVFTKILKANNISSHILKI